MDTQTAQGINVTQTQPRCLKDDDDDDLVSLNPNIYWLIETDTSTLWHQWSTWASYLLIWDANAVNLTWLRTISFMGEFMIICSSANVLAGSDSQFLKHTNSFFLILFTWYPECVLVLCHFSQHSTTNEYHVLTPWRVFNSNFKFLLTKNQKLLNDIRSIQQHILWYHLIFHSFSYS